MRADAEPLTWRDHDTETTTMATTKKEHRMFADKISELENRDDATKMALFCCEMFSSFDAPEYWYAFIIACERLP